MNIAFVTTQSPTQSTLVGRILPLATRLSLDPKHTVHILGHNGDQTATPNNITFHAIGNNPFTVQKGQKTRHTGINLITRLLRNTIGTCRALNRITPDVLVIVKPLPQNVAGTSLYVRWLSFRGKNKPRIILDVDDYELTANQLTSLLQRAAIHWSQQHAHHLADHIITATPFLQEYSRQLAPGHKPTLIPTTTDTPSFTPTVSENPTILYIGSLSLSSGHKVDLLPAIWKQVTSKHPTARLRLAGDGHDATAIKDMFSDDALSDSVTFTGRFTADDLPELLQDVAVIIDPIDASITNRAKSSYRASVSAFLGIPYLSSNIGVRPLWFPESLHDLFFAKPNDPVDYAKKLNHLLSHPLTTTQQQAMTAHAQQYSWEKLAADYLRILTS